MTNIQRVAVITGASQGIGEGLVSGFRKLGYAVVANSRTIADSDDPMVLAVPGDVAQPRVGQRIVDAALRRFGRIDTVVNNAGIFIPSAFTDYTDGDSRRHHGREPARLLRGFPRGDRSDAGPGRGRSRGQTSPPALSTTRIRRVPSALASLTKGGLNAVTKALAVEYADRGIRANTVALGIIRTPMHGESTHEALAKMHPIGRIGEVDDVVDAVLYLEDARFVTGEVLHVDGGQSAGH
jgi:NAD(P)-dependent dehydrogenase (short-subunit alcohol dehydrogenase family)